MDKKLTPSEIVIVVSGAVALVFSFLNWIGEPVEASAWSSDSLFPLSWLPMLFGVIMAAHVALTKFANVSFPEQVASFTWKQIHLALGAFATLLMIAWLIVDFGGADKGIGLWITLLASIGLLVGAVMLQREPESAGSGPGTAPPTPF